MLVYGLGQNKVIDHLEFCLGVVLQGCEVYNQIIDNTECSIVLQIGTITGIQLGSERRIVWVGDLYKAVTSAKSNP
jgi:hypothetical protein